jgi:hypothetical protein
MAPATQEATKLQQIFEDSYKLWNEGRYDDLAKRFDVDIIMKRLDDPGSVSGIGNVLVYLNKNQAPKRPQFKPDTVEDPIISDTVAQISGTARYLDKMGANPIPVRFTFTFTRADEDEDWLMINAFQARAKS